MPDKRAIDTAARVYTGDIRPGDADIIQRGMMGYPPSSETYKQLARALKLVQATSVEGGSPSTPLGLPTADFMLGTGVNADFASGLGSMIGGWPGEESSTSQTTGQRTESPSGLPRSNRENSGGFHGPSSNPGRGTTTTSLGTPVQNPDESRGPLTDVFNSGSEFPGGMGVVANSVHGMANNPVNTYDWRKDLDEVSSGYSFSGIAPGNMNMLLEDPAVFADIVAKKRGGGEATAAMDQNWMNAANQLAAMGIIGGSVDNTVFGGNWDVPSRLTAMEDVANLMAEPGMQFVNPRDLYAEAFRRADATDFSTLKGQNGEAVSVDDIIQITNGALQAQAPFMTPEAAAYLSSRLSGAALEYKSQLATGKTTLSYPAFLRSIGADQWQV